MNAESAVALAAWIAKNNPQLFDELAKRAGTGTLGAWTDVLKTIGSNVGTAVKAVGGFLASSDGIKTVSELGNVYLANKAQKNALQLQIEYAKASNPPLPIDTRVDPNTGQPLPYYLTPTGNSVPLTPQVYQQLRPPMTLQDYLPWIMLAAAGGFLIYFLTRR